MIELVWSVALTVGYLKLHRSFQSVVANPVKFNKIRAIVSRENLSTLPHTHAHAHTQTYTHHSTFSLILSCYKYRHAIPLNFIKMMLKIMLNQTVKFIEHFLCQGTF